MPAANTNLDKIAFLWLALGKISSTTDHVATGWFPTVDENFMTPRLDDGRELWRIACDSENLDANSPYFYLLWCRDFAATSLVARSRGGVCGFIAGFARPEEPETLFIWQVAVKAPHRGRGLAGRMLDHLAGVQYRFVEATVTPDNMASDRFLSAFARTREAPLERKLLLGSELFPGGHDPEVLYRIGPLGS